MKERATRLFTSTLLLMAMAIYAQVSLNEAISQGVVQPWVSPFLMLGKYKQEILNPKNLANLQKTTKKMFAEKQNLNPGQMFALSAQLYSLGAKDESVYWFYHGQYRARLFRRALKDYNSVRGRIGNKAFELWSAYSAFMQLNGTYLNGYAGCDLDKWLVVIRKVQHENREVPALNRIFENVAFKNKDKWSDINSNVSAGMDGLIRRLEEMRPNWKKLRSMNKVDEKHCN